MECCSRALVSSGACAPLLFRNHRLFPKRLGSGHTVIHSRVNVFVVLIGVIWASLNVVLSVYFSVPIVFRQRCGK